MAAGTDGEETFEEGYGKTSELAVQAVYKGTGAKGGWNGGKGPSWSVQKHFNSGKGEKGANRAGKGQWSKTGGKKGGKGQEKGGKGDTRVCWSCGKTGHIAANCIKGSWNRSLNAVEKTKETSVKKCMKTKMSCMRGVCWRRARMSNGRKSPARNRN